MADDTDYYQYDPEHGSNNEGAIIILCDSQYLSASIPSLEQAKERYAELGAAIEQAEQQGHHDRR